jgi:hypothetical protein
MIAFEDGGLAYESEKPFEVFFQNKQVGSFRLDLLVEAKVIVEVQGINGERARSIQISGPLLPQGLGLPCRSLNQFRKQKLPDQTVLTLIL